MKLNIVPLLLVLLLVNQNLCVRQKAFSVSKQKQINSLRNKGTWASFMLDLAEVQLKTGNPLDQLIDSIEEIVTDLDAKTEKAHKNFDQRTIEHNAEVDRINQLISNAQSDISTTTSLINDVLNVQILNLNQDIVHYTQGIDHTRQYISDEHALREKQHNNYVKITTETNQAILAIDEALEIITELDDGSQVSLIQTNKIKKNVNLIHDVYKVKTDGAMLLALTQVALNSQFADQGAVQKVISLMKDVKNNCVSSNQKSEEEENASQTAFETDMQNKKDDIRRMNQDLLDATEWLSQTEQKLVDAQEFLELRNKDLEEARQSLEEENTNYEQDEQSYNDLLNQIEQEQSALAAALDHLNNSSIEDYIGNRMESDVIIDQPHGMGITVEENPNDLE